MLGVSWMLYAPQWWIVGLTWGSCVCLGWDVGLVMRCHGMGKLGWLPRLGC